MHQRIPVDAARRSACICRTPPENTERSAGSSVGHWFGGPLSGPASGPFSGTHMMCLVRDQFPAAPFPIRHSCLLAQIPPNNPLLLFAESRWGGCTKCNPTSVGGAQSTCRSDVAVPTKLLHHNGRWMHHVCLAELEKLGMRGSDSMKAIHPSIHSTVNSLHHLHSFQHALV